jgi:hypothetical protein
LTLSPCHCATTNTRRRVLSSKNLQKIWHRQTRHFLRNLEKGKPSISLRVPSSVFCDDSRRMLPGHATDCWVFSRGKERNVHARLNFEVAHGSERYKWTWVSRLAVLTCSRCPHEHERFFVKERETTASLPHKNKLGSELRGERRRQSNDEDQTAWA